MVAPISLVEPQLANPQTATTRASAEMSDFPRNRTISGCTDLPIGTSDLITQVGVPTV
jgi:hypothetical protein